MPVPKTMQIFVLNISQQSEIQERLYRNLEQSGIDDMEIGDLLESSKDNRLCDLEEVIDIYSLRTVNVA